MLKLISLKLVSLELISLAINTDIIYPVSYNISEHPFSACLLRHDMSESGHSLIRI
jgi:hypothetical protein